MRPHSASSLLSHNEGTISRLVLVTLDSCRYDTALHARTPFLDSIAELRPARAHASFTLPAHTALFHGYPPTIVDDPNSYNPQKCSVMRLMPQYLRLNKAGSDARGTIPGDNLLDGLRRSGFRVVGGGGVRWFSTQQLRSYFDSFMYLGPNYGSDEFGLPLWEEEDFILRRSRDLSDLVGESERWFLFINAAETHAPYMTSDMTLIEKQRRYSKFRNGKGLLPNDSNCRQLMRNLKDLQTAALEDVDSRLQTLFERLARPFHFMITADHGECFGEDELWGHVFSHPTVLNIPMWEGYFE